MPESVEVRKFADILTTNILGKKITHINIRKGRYTKKPFEGYNELIKYLPLTIESINTKGKFTYIKLVNESKTNKKTFYLFNTLGLSGGWTLKSNNKKNFAKCNHCNYIEREESNKDESNESNKDDIFTFPTILEYITEDRQNKWFQRSLNHLNVEFITDYKNISFYFYDQLSFGTLKAVENTSGGNSDGGDSNSDTNPILEKKLKELGPDLLHDGTTFEIFKTQIRKKVNENKPIGNVIVNQKIISGVGNYLRADALWMAKISPFSKVKDIKDDDLKLLYKSVVGLIWGDYDYKNGVKKGYISSSLKLPNDYNRDFFIYRQDKDIYDNINIDAHFIFVVQEKFNCKYTL
jgi:formamidopyrimidine-DNA glycosylase